MKIKLIIIAITIILLSIFALYTISNDTTNNQIVDGLNSTSNFTQALNDAKLENKKVILIFDQNNCYYCDLFKEDTLSNSEVQHILNKYYIVVDIDINKESNLANDYKIFGTPCIIFLNKNKKELHRINGYIPAEEFLNSIKEI